MIVKQDAVHRRRRRVAGLGALLFVALAGRGMVALADDSGDAAPAPAPSVTASAKATPARPAPTVPAPLATPRGTPGPSDRTTLVRIGRLTGGLTPKSVVASPRGILFAQNMMYSHSVAVYRADLARLATIPDAVDLGRLGIRGHAGTSRGAPVEMAFSPDGRTAWVSNYAMYGAGFSAEPRDSCTGPGSSSRSVVYAVDTRSLTVTRAVQVGVVPKYVSVTPDGRRVLVTNWCSMDLTVVDAATATVVATVPTGGRHPRGIAVSPDSRTAYVAVMGSDRVVAVDLRTLTVRPFARTGHQPRHIVLSPDGSRLYVTDNGDDRVAEVDARTGAVLRRVAVGNEPRSMAISPDGRALYVVNYRSSSVSKIRTSDLTVVQTVGTDGMPIGITYEPTRKRVWVACYGGSLIVLDDALVAPAAG